MAGLPSSLLTGKQREAVAGDIDEEASRPRELKSRLRKRVYTGLKVDGHLLLEGLPRDERRKLFRGWEKDVSDGDLDELPGVRLLTSPIVRHGRNPENAGAKEEVEREELKQGITDLLAFLLIGIEEGNIGDRDEILEEAFSRAARRTDRSLETFDLDVEMGGLHVLTPAEIAEQVRAGADDITLQEVMLAIEKGELDPKEAKEVPETFEKVSEIFDRLAENITSDEEE